MALIFISYRRDDSGYVAGDVSDKLQQHFGPDSVFIDIDNIPLGVDFREYIGNEVGKCDVLLAIIGDQWMGPADSQGKRRIDDPADFVRIEIESALKRNIPVIPVLVEKATMPSPADLPSAIQSIAYRNAAEIRMGRDRRQHIEQLILGLEKIIKSNPSGVKDTTEEQPDPSEKKSASSERKSPAKGTKTRLRKFVEETGWKPTKKSGDSSELLGEIRKVLKDCTDSHLYLGEAIPADKLGNAVSAYAPGVAPKDVLLLYDNTVFGGAKDGLLLTSDAVYWHNISTKPGQFRYSEIESVDVNESTSIFVAAMILLNQEKIELSVGDKLGNNNKLAQAVANVIRFFLESVKQ